MIIENMLDKVLKDQQLNLDLALAWCLNDKNSLANVHGFSPVQLLFGQNLNLPSIFTDKPSAYTSADTSKFLGENLSGFYEIGLAFIASKSSEKSRRALNNNIRTSGDLKYVTGDKVCYKRVSHKCWKGPGCVLGQDGQQVLAKHSSHYVQVHPWRLSLERTITNTEKKTYKQHSKHRNKVERGQNSIISDESNSDGRIQYAILDNVLVSTQTSQQQNKYKIEDLDNITVLTSVLSEQNKHEIHDLNAS